MYCFRNSAGQESYRLATNLQTSPMKKLVLLLSFCFSVTLSVKAQSVAFTSWRSFDTSNTQDLYWMFDADSVYFSLDNVNWMGVSAYWETGPAIRLLDSPSTGQCADTGDYTEAYSGDTLWLNYVSDTCSDRVLYLGTHYFINQMTSVPSLDEIVQSSVAPNPANDFFTVTSTLTPERIIMFDVTGRVLHDEKPLSNQTTIYPKDASPGVYFVKVHFSDNYTVQRVIIE